MRRATLILLPLSLSLLTLVLSLSFISGHLWAETPIAAKLLPKTAVSLPTPPAPPTTTNAIDFLPLTENKTRGDVPQPPSSYLPLAWWRQQAEAVSRETFPVNWEPFPASRGTGSVSREPFPVNREPFPASRGMGSVSREPFPVNREPFSNSPYPINNSPLTNPNAPSPLPSSLYTLTLQPLHRATGYPGFSSAFAFTNTGSTAMGYYLHFYWLNGQYLMTDGPYPLNPGQSMAYNMDTAVFGETTFVGYVTITGDEPFTGQITTPNYGLIQGIIVEDDGFTPAQVYNTGSRAPAPNWQEYGNTYNLGDGRFYLGGLPDGNYNLWVHAPYPWRSQWYNGHTAWQDADLLTISSAGTVNITVTLQPGGRITGTVYAADGLTPLPNINVDIEGGGYGSCTNSYGRYTLEGLPYGDHKVLAGGGWNWCLSQDSPYVTEYYSQTNDSSTATPIPLSPGHDDVHHINFTLDIGGIITGYVHDNATGLPIANVLVSTSEYDTGWYGRNTWTDASGAYTLTGLLTADYRVAVDNTNHRPPGYANQYYNHQVYHHLADRLTVTLGNTIPNINFDLLPGGGISGTVYADDGLTPLSNVHINAETAQGGFGACTDENGRYAITGIPYNDYTVRASGGWNWCLNQPSDYILEYYPETTDYNQADIFTLDSTTPFYTDINFTLTLGGRIIGQVTDANNGQPLAGVRVNANAFTDENPWASDGWSDANGVYTITGLYDSDFRIAIDDINWIPDGYAFQYYQGALDWRAATPVNITGANTVTGIDFPLLPGGIISGRVLDQNSGLPIANQNVSADGNGWGRGTCTDDAGYYTARAMPYGEYRVHSGGDWNWCQNRINEYSQEYYLEKRTWDQADILTLDGSSTPIPNINFTLEKGGFLAGHVTDDTLQPVANLRMIAVQASPYCTWCANHIADSYTDAAGNYIIGPLPPDSYSILADTDQNGQLLVKEYYDDVYDFTAATYVTVTNEMTTSGLDFILDPGVWITGHVTVPPGYSAANIPVDTWKVDGIGFGSNRRTDINGDYLLPVPPIYDSYWGVRVHPDGPDLMYQWAHQFDLAQHTHWDFDLGLGGTITGCLSDGGTAVANVWINANSGVMNNGDQTDANGCYAITNLPPGAYELWADDWNSGRMRVGYGGYNWERLTLIPLHAGETLTGFDFELPWRGQIEGYVTDSDGLTPLEGVRVTAATETGYWEGYSQPDGYFTIDVSVGTYKVLFGLDPFLYAYYPHSSVHQYADATPVTVGPLPATTFITMSLERPSTVHGQITDSSSGQPLGGIHIVVQNIDPLLNRDMSASSCTDENGAYAFTGVWPGESLVQAIGTCGNWPYGLVTDTLTIAPNSDYELNLQMTHGSMPPRPFTVYTQDSYDYTPLSSGGNTFWDNQFYAEQILAALYEPLVALDDSGNWTSDLLTEIPTLDNGGAAIHHDHLVVTYTLQPGLFWSDGAALTSADIRFTWEMLTTPTPWSDTWLAQMGHVNKIAAITTPNALTAVATYQFRDFPPSYLLALTYLLPEHALAGQYPMDLRWVSHFAHYPIGNGPYMVADWVPGSHLDLVINPNYHRLSQGLPHIPQLRFLFTNHPFYSVAGGVADVGINVGGSLPPDYQSYGLAIHESEDLAYWSIIPNTERPYFQETAVRQAIYTAFDRAQAVPHIANGLVANSWLAPSHPLYSDTLALYPYDPPAAAAMLTAAGWVDHNGNGIRDKNGVELQFQLFAGFNSNQSYLNIAAIFQANLAAVGIDVTIIDYPNNDNNQYWRDIQRGLADAFMVGWYFDERLDPLGYNIFHSSQIPTGYNSYNPYGQFGGRWVDGLNDALLAAAHTELDTAVLHSLYADHLAWQTTQLPIWPLAHRKHVDTAVPTLLHFRPAAYLPATWNIAEWLLPDNPYDLSVRKTLAASSPAPQPGSDIIYALTVRNIGYFTITNATLIDTLPPEVTFVTAQPAPTTISGGALIWQLGSIPGSSTPQLIEVTVHIPLTMTHGTELVNAAEVFGDQPDTFPGNNGFSYLVTVRDDVDLAVHKFGVGQPAVGEIYNYYLDYANWGGAPADGATLTDTLPAEVTYLAAVPAPDVVAGQTLVWNLPPLVGNQWGGQIEITAEIVGAGTVTNTADLLFGGVDVNLSNNSAASTAQVADILPPLITHPTQGVADGTPTIAGLAPSLAVVELWDLSSVFNLSAPTVPTLLITTTANVSGTFAVELALNEGTYIVTAVAKKAGLTSNYANTTTFEVRHDLPLDTDSVAITADGATISRGVVRANKYTMPHRLLDIGVNLACASGATPPSTHLEVTENALFTYDVPTVSLTDLGGNQWRADFRLWLAEPHSTYDIWLEWECDGLISRELLVYILIDPDGYAYDQSWVDAGSPITDSLLLDAVITAYVLVGNEWQVWPAAYYGQTNPQVTDTSTPDGVMTAGYYSFLTPPGQYRLTAVAPGYQPYQSEVLSVVDTPIHLDIGLQPVTGGSGHTLSPANLSASSKTVDRNLAWVGEVLTYDVWLANSGEEETAVLHLADLIPAYTDYISGSLHWDVGTAGYDASGDQVWWQVVVPGLATAHLQYQISVADSPGVPFDIVNTSQVSGTVANLATLGTLTAVTTVQNSVGLSLSGDAATTADPGVTVAYQVQIGNTGNSTDTFMISADSSAGWLTSSFNPVTVGPGVTTTLPLEVQIPAIALAGVQDVTTLTIASSLSSAVEGDVTFTTTANQVAGINLSAAPGQSAAPGTAVTYTHQLQNLGNGVDTFVVTAVSDLGWPVTVTANPTLQPGASSSILVVVQIPAGTAPGTADTTTLTVHSTFANGVWATTADATTAVQVGYNLYLPIITRR